MPVTKVGAIYATQSLLLQRVYIPHADDSEISQQNVGSGETSTTVLLATYQTGGASAVQAVIGTPTFSGRCAIVDGTNTVINHIIADPAVYGSTDASGNQVIANDHTCVGDTWNGTQFQRLWAEASPSTGLIVKITTNPIAPTPVPATAGNVMISLIGPLATLKVGDPIIPVAV